VVPSHGGPPGSGTVVSGRGRPSGHTRVSLSARHPRLMPMPLRGVLFDLDETLIRQRDATQEAMVDAVARCALSTTIGPDRLAQVARKAAKEIWRTFPSWPWCERMGIDGVEALSWPLSGDGEELALARAALPALRTRVWSLALADQGCSDSRLAERLSAKYVEIQGAHRKPYPDAAAVLQDLRRLGLALAIVSNGAPDAQRHKLAAAGLSSDFDSIVISCEVGVAKPEPAIFQKALADLRIAPDEALMVGDSYERDIAGAKSAGLATAFIQRRPARAPQTSLADWTLPALHGLPPLVASLLEGRAHF
jgi:putative hydrolase of the HAD superfamily